MLLAAPLSTAADGNRAIFILLDALDESHPPEPHKTQAGSSTPQRSINAAGKNQALCMAYLAAKLPGNVRFIFTSRPDNNYQDIMSLIYSDITFMEPCQMRHEKGGQSRMLLYDSVVKGCGLQTAAPEPDRATMGPDQAASSGESIGMTAVVIGIQDVYGVYKAVFDRNPPTGVVLTLLQVNPPLLMNCETFQAILFHVTPPLHSSIIRDFRFSSMACTGLV